MNPEESKLSSNGTDQEAEDGPDQQVSLETQLEENLDFLTEKSKTKKRTSTRESGLQFLKNALSNSFQEEFVMAKRETLTESLKRSIKKGGPNERVLACQLLSVITITLGTSADHLYKEMRPMLEEIISFNSSFTVKSAAADALTTLCFIGDTDEEETLSCMSLYEGFFETESYEFLTHILEDWALLATTVSLNNIRDRVFPETLPKLADLLDAENLEIRQAAGENIAMLFEYQRDIEKEAFDLFDYDGYVDLNDLINKLRSLSSENVRYIAKKERIKQRSTFRSICSSVEEGTLPEEVLSFKHQKISFSGWSKIKQLNFFRNSLSTGFHAHFVENELFHQIFDRSFDKNFVQQKLSDVEKRLVRSPNSAIAKARSIQKRSRQRRVASTYAVDDE